MRIVFMGTPDFSVPTLEALVKGGHEVLAVVTQPDKPKGRGKSVLMTPVKEKAMELGIPVYQPVKVREPEFMEVLKGLDAEAFVVVAFGQILPKEILEMPRYGCVNVHASLLPRYRGAAVGCYLSSEDSEVEIRENGDGVLAVVEGREKNLVMVQENLGIIRGYAKDAYLKLFKDENGGVFAIGFGGRMLPRK